jgi:predicted NBD/HSP70 family sugar kinase
MTPTRIGVDIGGTSTKAALLGRGGEIVVAEVTATRPGPEGVVRTALDAIAAITSSARIAPEAVHLIGVGIPGAVDIVTGTVCHAVNVGIGSTPVHLAAAITDRFPWAVVHVENDVKAAALGAHVLTAARRTGRVDLAYLSVGTGIAAGFVENGRIRHGVTFVAGEIGHIPIDPNGPTCACGQTGCIEAIASGSAIERDWPTTARSPVRALAAAAAAGDARAATVWHDVIGALSRAVQLLTLTLDPHVVVLSGGVAELGDVLRNAIVDRLADDQRHSPFLRSLDLGSRLEIIDPSVLLGTLGAVHAAVAAGS